MRRRIEDTRKSTLLEALFNEPDAERAADKVVADLASGALILTGTLKNLTALDWEKSLKERNPNDDR
jgi:hypothetical protein